LPEIIDGEVCPTLGKLNESICDEATWAGVTLAGFLEGGTNFVCDHCLL